MEILYCIGDCETGGLDERINPILSAAFVLADENFEEVDGFAAKLKPPENSWLEVPVLSQQVPNFGYGPRKIEY